MVVEPAVELPPLRSEHPCGVPDCYVTPQVVEQDEKYTVVECAVHDTLTRWDTVEIKRGEQQVIRLQDNWHKYGTSGRPK